MEKDTRTFIWGLILLITGSIALSTHIIEIKNNVWEFSIWKTMLLLGSILSIIIGGYKVINTTN